MLLKGHSPKIKPGAKASYVQFCSFSNKPFMSPFAMNVVCLTKTKCILAIFMKSYVYNGVSSCTTFVLGQFVKTVDMH